MASSPLNILWRRLVTHLWMKLRLAALLAIIFCVPYFLLQHIKFGSVHPVPITPIDRWIAFSPRWVWGYQSIYLLMSLATWFVVSREQLYRFARGFIAMSVAAFVVFVLYPVASPRPASIPHDFAYQLLRSYDGTRNCMPSLHAAFAVFAGLFGYVAWASAMSRPWRRIYCATVTLWIAIILYATLATKQHWAVDLPPGIALAWLAHRWTQRQATSPSASVKK